MRFNTYSPILMERSLKSDSEEKINTNNMKSVFIKRCNEINELKRDIQEDRICKKNISKYIESLNDSMHLLKYEVCENNPSNIGQEISVSVSIIALATASFVFATGSGLVDIHILWIFAVFMILIAYCFYKLYELRRRPALAQLNIILLEMQLKIISERIDALE